MPILKIMTKEAGDMTFGFNNKDVESVQGAKEVFDEFMKDKKYLAYKKTPEGNEKITEFDAQADMIMSPQLVGG